MGDPFEKIATVLWVISLFIANAILTEQEFDKFMPYFFIVGAVLMVIYYERLRRANEKIIKQKQEIEYQKQLVEEKNKEITDSINYALRIQTAILPPARIVQEYLLNSFILYKPKAIVSGDFYWMETNENTIYFAACDCTGHGVPGALVSMVCHNALNRAVREFHISQPSDILNKVNELVIDNFEKGESQLRDGMDTSLCAFNSKTKILEWAGANNPLWLIKEGEFIETKADKQSIGNIEDSHPFTNHSFELKSGDSIYIFSDGYADQFGANGDKKITKKRFSELVLSLQGLSMQEQGTAFDNFINDHKKNTPQTDDILVMGVQI
jgi:serine phosphatase RsbU (regulator of sigma subunit)